MSLVLVIIAVLLQLFLHLADAFGSELQQQFLAYTIVTKGSMSRYRPTVCWQTALPKCIGNGPSR